MSRDAYQEFDALSVDRKKAVLLRLDGESLSERDITEAFESELEEIYGEVEICGLKYSAVRALQEVDPIAYRCAFADWISASETLVELSDAETYEVDKVLEAIDALELEEATP